MVILRLICLLLLVASVLSLAIFLVNGQPRFRTWGLRLLRATVGAGLLLLALLILERLSRLL